MSKHYEKSMAEQYNRYYRSGLYQTRYPKANPNVLRFIHTQLSLLPIHPNSQILDFGCGQGRYLLALANTYNLHYIGYDISQKAIDGLEETLLLSHQSSHKIHLFSQKEALDKHLKSTPAVSLNLMMFGVLSHIENRAERISTLMQNQAQLAPNHGCILLSVPNRRRRFLVKQMINIIKNWRFQKSDSVQYERKGGIQLHYYLYSLSTLKKELKEAHLEPVSLGAESILPESWLLAHPLIARLDNLLANILPLQCAYGFLVLAKPIPPRKRNNQPNQNRHTLGGKTC
jgi:SAM-dependent methyltransferase